MTRSFQKLKILFIVNIFFIASNTIFSDSWFYTNSFSTMVNFTNDWTTNWKYGMEGLTVDSYLQYSSKFISSNGLLKLQGNPYTNMGGGYPDWQYNGFWTAYAAILNRSFNASSTNPFGFEIKRVYTRLNPDDPPNPSPAERCQSQFDIWLVEDTGLVSAHRDQYDYFIMLYENGTRGDTTAPNDISELGYYTGTKHPIDFNYCTNALGNQINLTNSAIHSINWKYNWVGESGEGALDDGDINYPNTNQYIFKFVHNGSYVSMYVNPDPDDNDNYPNEFCLVARRQVLWQSNLKIILGHEVMERLNKKQDVSYDFIKIKSSTDSSKAFIYPNEIYPIKNGNSFQPIKFSIIISNIIGPTNAGINYIEIENPRGMDFAFEDLSKCVIVSSLANKTEKLFETINFTGDKYPTENQVAVFAKNINENNPKTEKRIHLILGTQLTNISEKEKAVNIKINLSMVPISDFLTGDFGIFVEARQFNGMKKSYGRGSTCGLQKCTGNTKISIKQSYSMFDY